jgi:cation diffusion facilitator family transporter
MMAPREANMVHKIPTQEKQAVALTSVVAAVLLITMKLTVGLWTGSLGIISEAMHSGLDLVAAVVTYVSVRVSDKPADPAHPFGHGKIESLSAFVETTLLFVTCAWIIWEAIRRLFFHEVHVEPSLTAFGVMFIAVTIDTFRSRALFRVARKYNSQALEADALHFSTDVYSSSVVILGLILVYVSNQSNIRWLRKADPVAALVVAGIVVYITLKLGKRTVAALVDASPEGSSSLIAEAVSRVPGVLRLERIRTRQSGPRLFVDLRLALHSNTSLEHAKAVADLVESAVHDLFPDSDVVIHTTPSDPPTGDLVEKIRSIANRRNFQVHEVTAYEVKGCINVILDLEVEPSLRLDTAHDQATVLEQDIKQGLPEVREVNIHLEPFTKNVEAVNAVQLTPAELEPKLMEIAREIPGVLDCHDIEAHQAAENVFVRCHCTLLPALPIARVHDITEELEFRIRKAFPQILRVNIHAEPKGQS